MNATTIGDLVLNGRQYKVEDIGEAHSFYFYKVTHTTWAGGEVHFFLSPLPPDEICLDAVSDLLDLNYSLGEGDETLELEWIQMANITVLDKEHNDQFIHPPTIHTITSCLHLIKCPDDSILYVNQFGLIQENMCHYKTGYYKDVVAIDLFGWYENQEGRKYSELDLDLDIRDLRYWKNDGERIAVHQ